jgi:hypothetical protein
MRVTLANGSRCENGYIVRAKPGTIRKPAADEEHLRIKWYAVGQFRYFDNDKWIPVRVSDSIGDKDYISENVSVLSSVVIRPYRDGIPGKDKRDPENQLVRAYVKWIDREERFGESYIRPARLFADLFDRRFWRLIEAKAFTDRFMMRTAVGQLYDYRRFFSRRPSMGVLIPDKPSKSQMEFLQACNVVAIWRTPSGRFTDSSKDKRWSVPRL